MQRTPTRQEISFQSGKSDAVLDMTIAHAADVFFRAPNSPERTEYLSATVPAVFSRVEGVSAAQRLRIVVLAHGGSNFDYAQLRPLVDEILSSGSDADRVIAYFLQWEAKCFDDSRTGAVLTIARRVLCDPATDTMARRYAQRMLCSLSQSEAEVLETLAAGLQNSNGSEQIRMRLMVSFNPKMNMRNVLKALGVPSMGQEADQALSARHIVHKAGCLLKQLWADRNTATAEDRDLVRQEVVTLRTLMTSCTDFPQELANFLFFAGQISFYCHDKKQARSDFRQAKKLAEAMHMEKLLRSMSAFEHDLRGGRER